MKNKNKTFNRIDITKTKTHTHTQSAPPLLKQPFFFRWLAYWYAVDFNSFITWANWLCVREAYMILWDVFFRGTLSLAAVFDACSGLDVWDEMAVDSDGISAVRNAFAHAKLDASKHKVLPVPVGLSNNAFFF